MKKQKQDDLERLISRELRQLQDLRAPETLLHRVMLAVHERERRPWWKRSWPEWPRNVQALSLVALAAFAGAVGAAVTGWLTAADLEPVWAQLRGLTEVGATAWSLVETMGNAVVLLVKSAGRPVIVAGCAVVFASYALGVGALTTCYRFATQRA